MWSWVSVAITWVVRAARWIVRADKAIDGKEDKPKKDCPGDDDNGAD